MSYAPLVYKSNGGDKLVVGAGGVLNIESGGALQVAGVDVTTAVSTISASLLHQATVLLTNDQIKALPTTPYTLIAAPGSNRLIVSTMVLLQKYFTAGAYTNNSADGYVVLGDASANEVSAMVTAEQFIAANQVVFGLVTSGGPLITGTYEGFQLGPAWLNSLNLPLRLTAINAAGDYTGGNAANTLRVSVVYYVLNLTTGVFE